MPYVRCPGCDERLRLVGTPSLGQRIYCETCEDDLEVVSLEPLEVDWVIYGSDDDGDDDEEWEYDDDDED